MFKIQSAGDFKELTVMRVSGGEAIGQMALKIGLVEKTLRT